MSLNNNNKTNVEDNLIASLIYKLVPFWPFLLGLLILGLAAGWGYLHYYATPTYAVSASLLVKDEEKGVNTSKMAESIDAFTSNKIVDNEINVLRSHALMNRVVRDLHLYAPVFEESRFKDIPAYTTSPITIKLKSLKNVKEVSQVYFTYDASKGKVIIEGKAYPLDKWIKTPFGILQFSENERQNGAASGPLYFSILQPKSVANKIISNIIIESPGKYSSMINLYLEDKVPERGEDIVNTLIQAYQQAAIDDRNQLADQTLEFVESRIGLIEKELADLENKIVKYKSSQGAIDLDEQGRLFLKNVGENDKRLAEINLELEVLNKVEKYVKSKDKSIGIVPSTLGIDSPILSNLLQKLYDAEIEYEQLSKTTAVNNPTLISLRQEIESIRPSILENIRNQRENLMASRSNVIATNNQYNAVLQSLPSKERELLEYSRQQAIKNDAYSFLLQKREETVLSHAPTAEEVKVVDLAESSSNPVSPKPMYVYFGSALLALGLGIGLVLAKEVLTSKVLFRSEIERYINAPIVAELSKVKSDSTLLFQEGAEIAQIEQFRQLRVTLGLYGRTFTRKKIMVTSSIPSEGKSYVSSNLAASLAASGKKVALLDFDLRNPSTSGLFNLQQEEGIIEYLMKGDNPGEFVRPTDVPNLYMIPAGINVGDHTELLLNYKTEVLFKYLEDTFDYIILDTAPIDLVSDAYLLAEYCDITLLVIKHDYTPKRLVMRLGQNNKLGSLKSKLAVVFNGVKPRGFVKGQYGYGYGYGYENKYDNKKYMAKKLTTKS